MVPKKEPKEITNRFDLEGILGSKVAVAVLRQFCRQPYLSFGLTELSLQLGISKSNLLRILNGLEKNKLLLPLERGRKKKYRLDSSREVNKLLWQLFMAEEKENLDYRFKNTLDLFFQKINPQVTAFIVFGSVAKGLAEGKSDIDVLVVSQRKISSPVLEYFPQRIEVHTYSLPEVKEPRDFVVLDALMNGIVYKGNLLEIIEGLRFLPKAYLLYRLQKCREYSLKLKTLSPTGKMYYQQLLRISLGEIDSLLHKKKILAKREIKINLNKLPILEKEVSALGEKIWLT